jgi:hypothetical protein
VLRRGSAPDHCRRGCIVVACPLADGFAGRARDEGAPVLTGWAEAIAEALAHDPARVAAVLADAGADAPWRAELALVPPAIVLSEAVETLRRFVLAHTSDDMPSPYDALLAAASREVPGEPPLDSIVRRVLLAMLEERQTRWRLPTA